MAFVDDIDTLGFTSHWRLDETSGTTADDRIDTDDGTYGAGVTLNQTGGGDDGNAAIELDGSSSGSYVDITGPTDGVSYDAQLLTDRTVFVTGLLDSTTDRCLFYQQGGQFAGFWLYQWDDDDIYLILRDNDGTVFSDSGAFLSASTWFSLCITLDTTADLLKLYVDGTEEMSIDISTAVDKTILSQVVVGDTQGSEGNAAAKIWTHLGETRGVGLTVLDGKIGEVAYASGVVLTASEVSDLHDVWLNGDSGAVNTAPHRYYLQHLVTPKSYVI